MGSATRRACLRQGERAWLAHPWGLARANTYGRAIERGADRPAPCAAEAAGAAQSDRAEHPGPARGLRACLPRPGGELAGPEAGLAAALALDALVVSQEQGGS